MGKERAMKTIVTKCVQSYCVIVDTVEKAKRFYFYLQLVRKEVL